MLLGNAPAGRTEFLGLFLGCCLCCLADWLSCCCFMTKDKAKRVVDHYGSLSGAHSGRESRWSGERVVYVGCFLEFGYSFSCNWETVGGQCSVSYWWKLLEGKDSVAPGSLCLSITSSVADLTLAFFSLTRGMDAAGFPQESRVVERNEYRSLAFFLMVTIHVFSIFCSAT